MTRVGRLTFEWANSLIEFPYKMRECQLWFILFFYEDSNVKWP